MDRRAFVTGLGAVLAAPIAIDAQQASRVAQIGYLEFGTAAPGTSFLETCRQGLHDFGWTEGTDK